MTILRRASKAGRKFLNPVPTTIAGFSTLFKLLPRFLSNKEEKSPRRALGPFRTDVSVYGTAPESGLRVTWMGHSSLLVEIDGVRVLVDPVWDERASPSQWAGPKWVTSLGVGEVLRQFEVRAQITELDWTQSVVVGGLEITAVPSRHFSGRGLTNRFETLWSAFVLKGPKHTVYFGADSGWWEGFAEIGAAYGPFDLAMLEIGAFDVMWDGIHLGPDGAARAFEALGGADPQRRGLMMPIHWGLFDLALHAWRQPIERLVEVAGEKKIKLWAPEPGRPTEVVAGVEVRSDWWR